MMGFGSAAGNHIDNHLGCAGYFSGVLGKPLISKSNFHDETLQIKIAFNSCLCAGVINGNANVDVRQYFRGSTRPLH